MSSQKVFKAASEASFFKRDYPANPRLTLIVLTAETLTRFYQALDGIDVQALEYKPFMRFRVAQLLDEAAQSELGSSLRSVLHDRSTGAFMLQADIQEAWATESEFRVVLATAIAHLIGVSNYDSMAGSYYARFSVRHDDSSDSYLRQGYRVMELHTDGTYVKEDTDWVLMMKMKERHVEGGESLLLHLDDWSDLERFFNDPMARESIQWGAPSSKNIDYKIHHSVFGTDPDGKPVISYIDQFAEPRNMAQAQFLYNLSESLETSADRFKVGVAEGSLLVVNNRFWLHGRDVFTAHPGLHRELLRQRGHFSD